MYLVRNQFNEYSYFVIDFVIVWIEAVKLWRRFFPLSCGIGTDGRRTWNKFDKLLQNCKIYFLNVITTLIHQKQNQWQTLIIYAKTGVWFEPMILVSFSSLLLLPEKLWLKYVYTQKWSFSRPTHVHHVKCIYILIIIELHVQRFLYNRHYSYFIMICKCGPRKLIIWPAKP